MSDRDQPDDEFVEESAAKATSGTIERTASGIVISPLSMLTVMRKIGALSRTTNPWVASLNGPRNPSISEEIFDGSEREPEQGVSLSDNADESDSLFDDDDLDDDNVTLGSSRSSKGEPGSNPSDGSAVDEFDAEEDEDAATSPATPRDQEGDR